MTTSHWGTNHWPVGRILGQVLRKTECRRRADQRLDDFQMSIPDMIVSSIDPLIHEVKVASFSGLPYTTPLRAIVGSLSTKIGRIQFRMVQSVRDRLDYPRPLTACFNPLLPHFHGLTLHERVASCLGRDRETRRRDYEWDNEVQAYVRSEFVRNTVAYCWRPQSPVRIPLPEPDQERRLPESLLMTDLERPDELTEKADKPLSNIRTGGTSGVSTLADAILKDETIPPSDNIWTSMPWAPRDEIRREVYMETRRYDDRSRPYNDQRELRRDDNRDLRGSSSSRRRQSPQRNNTGRDRTYDNRRRE